MKSHLTIYFPGSVQTGTEQVMRGITEGAHAEAAACRCPFFIHRVQEISQVPGSKGMMGMFGASDQRKLFLKLCIPLVNVSNQRGPVPGMANVLSDDIAVGRMAAEHLLEKGYRHFLALGQSDSHWSRERLKGFLEVVQGKGLPAQAADLDLSAVRQDYRPAVFLETLWEQMEPLLRDAPLATGIFAANDWQAWPVLESFREKYPERLHTTGLLGVDNLHDQLFDPGRTEGLSSIQPGFRGMGAHGLRLLIDAARDGRDIRGVLARVPPEKLHARGSTAGQACGDPVVSRVLRELWAALRGGEDIHLGDLARRHGMSPRKMELRFESHLGMSARMLVADMRIQYGQELLRDTSLTVTEISRRCGYANTSTFSTLFGEKTGATPREWRLRRRPPNPDSRLTSVECGVSVE